jgi:hypothetical protein
MREHSLGKIIPRASDKLQVFPEMANYRIAKAPAKMDDWIYSDKAQLDLYITSFSDATFVTITWLHTLLDAMGRHALLSAWQLVLAGRDNELPPFIGYNSDPLSSLGVKRAGIQHEESVLKPKLWYGTGYGIPKKKAACSIFPPIYSRQSDIKRLAI